MTVKYTSDHEWINIEDHEAATVGITHHAQDALGDVVFVDLPAVGTTFKKGEVAGVVESVKAAADLYMPVTGEIVEVNEALRADPSLANTDPLGKGWFFKVHVADPAEFDQLMDQAGLRRAGQERLNRSPDSPQEFAMLMSAHKPLAELENASEFVARHIGIEAADEAHMLSVIGAASRRALIEAIVPRSIVRAAPMALPAPLSEAQALAELKAIAGRTTAC